MSWLSTRGARKARIGGRKKLIAGIAGGVAVLMLVTLAVFAEGFDTRELPRLETSVWVTRDSGQYARVNTETGEIDTVRQAVEPAQVLQSGENGIILGSGLSRAWPINPAFPADFALDTAGSGDSEAGDQGAGAASEARSTQAENTPSGTREVLSAGPYFALRTENGEVYAGRLEDHPGQAAEGGLSLREGTAAGRIAGATRIDPLAGTAAAGPEEPGAEQSAGDTESAGSGESNAGYLATAIALDERGRLALFSAEERAVRTYDAASGEFTGGTRAVPREAAAARDPQLTLSGGDWALLEPESGTLWRQGIGQPVTLELGEDAKLQHASAGSEEPLLIADSRGLWQVAGGEAPERLVEAAGIPARPRGVDGQRYAAWLDAAEGTLWSSASGATTTLDYDPEAGAAGRRLNPVIQSNGSRAVLSERDTGMLWTLPAGTLIPLSLWTLAQPPREDSGTVVVEDVSESLPPVAVPDSFGVRAGGHALLPVLLNDYDPNRKDILTIIPELIGAISPAEFGAVEVLPGAQGLAIRVAENAGGTASFSYQITDGTHVSEPATVTLTVAPEGTDSAPEWCGVEGCQLAWPSPELTPGGTLVLPILASWVDPQGDPLFLASARARDPEAPVRVVATEDGRVAVRHTDPNAADAAIAVDIVVRDANGNERERSLMLNILAAASARMESAAVTIPVGQRLSLHPLEQASGGSGSFQLVDAVLPQGAGSSELRLTPQPGTATLEVEPSVAGSFDVQLTVRDTLTQTEFGGQLRVIATETAPRLTLPPTRAYVRAQQDTIVNVLDAVPDPGDRVLLLEDASVSSGDLAVQTLNQERLRVTGYSPDGAAGRVGTAELRIGDGSGEQATGQLTVFQLPEVSDSAVIAVADYATVRAGSVVDIDVLANDVSTGAERLLLDPVVGGSGAEGELAFISGDTLRYLAPNRPGVYTLTYSSYLENSPERRDTGQVRVNVIAADNNRAPQPAVLTARLVPGQNTRVAVPLTGVDPDGDRVRLIAVDSSERITATVAATGDEILVEASEDAEPGVLRLGYTVRDGFGADATGELRVAVSAAAERDSAPITVSDQVRLMRGTSATTTVEPLLNDVDPTLGTLELISVEPNVSGAAGTPEYDRLRAMITLDDLASGRVVLHSGPDAGSHSYRYTVRSTRSGSTAEGLIVVQISDRVGTQAPIVADTTLTARDRAVLAGAGVDVLTGRVRWSSGDPEGLALSVWGDAASRFRVAGPRLIGEYRASGDLVPFRLAGTDNTGAAVETFGFLVVPPLEEIRVGLRAGLRPIEVDENNSVTVSVEDVVERVPGERIELRPGALPTQRAAASCSASGQDIRYSAGAEAPWQDRCLIDVRLPGQNRWTALSLPIQISPREPQVELDGLTRVIRPGGEESVDLAADMVRWQGGRVGDMSALRFSLGERGSLFQLSQEGTVLRVVARADAPPGSEERVIVDVRGAGEGRATLILRVGDAPRETPRGATVSSQCTVGAGGCRVRVVGVPGEFDPFAGRPGGGLVLDSISGSSCPVARFGRAGEDAVEITWPSGQTNGATCTVPFTVRDSQGRLGEGRIEFDAQGLPQAPAAITTAAYTGSSLTLDVALGEALGAHPEVTGVRLGGDGSSSASCAPSTPGTYRCEVTGLTNGQQHRFTARAVNAVGASAETSPVTAWAYQAPRIDSVNAAPRYEPGVTSESQGSVRVSIAAAADTRAFRIDGREGEVPRSGGTTIIDMTLPVGSTQIRVTPLSAFEPPMPGGNAEGDRGTAAVTVAGAPRITGRLGVRAEGDTGLVASGIGGDANGSDRPLSVIYRVAERPAAVPECRVDDGGALIAESGDLASGEFSGLSRRRHHDVRACVSNGYGVVGSDVVSMRTGGKLPTPVVVSGYEVATTPTRTPEGDYVYRLRTAPVVEVLSDMVLQYRQQGADWRSELVLDPNSRATRVEARQCFADELTRCSDPVPVGALTVPTEVIVSGIAECVAADQTVLRPLPTVTAGANRDARVSDLMSDPSRPGLRFAMITWSGAFSALPPLELSFPLCTVPPEDPDEDDK